MYDYASETFLQIISNIASFILNISLFILNITSVISNIHSIILDKGLKVEVTLLVN